MTIQIELETLALALRDVVGSSDLATAKEHAAKALVLVNVDKYADPEIGEWFVFQNDTDIGADELCACCDAAELEQGEVYEFARATELSRVYVIVNDDEQYEFFADESKAIERNEELAE